MDLCSSLTLHSVYLKGAIPGLQSKCNCQISQNWRPQSLNKKSLMSSALKARLTSKHFLMFDEGLPAFCFSNIYCLRRTVSFFLHLKLERTENTYFYTDCPEAIYFV